MSMEVAGFSVTPHEKGWKQPMKKDHYAEALLAAFIASGDAVWEVDPGERPALSVAVALRSKASCMPHVVVVQSDGYMLSTHPDREKGELVAIRVEQSSTKVVLRNLGLTTYRRRPPLGVTHRFVKEGS